jgi:8-oxo-dGTP pyrophosphatase MutT (NUDIX family)
MAHIHTAPGQHDHTVSMYVFRTDFNEPKVLLHIHKKSGAYAQFGGHVELNENPWQTTVHELIEETGYNIEQVEILQPQSRMVHVTDAIVHPYPVVHCTMGYPNDKTHFHTDSAYAFIADGEPANAPMEGESTDLQLFTREEIAALSNVDGVTRDIALYIFDNCLEKWRSVPTKDFK